MRTSIGIDVGTTNTKVVLYCLNTYDILEMRTFGTPTSIIDEGINIELEILFDKIEASLKKIIFDSKVKQLDFISIASVGEAGVLVNNETHFATSIMWHDSRGFEYCEKDLMDGYNFYQKFGIPNHSNYSIWKILYHKNKDGVNLNSYQWISIADFVAYKLNHEIKLDASIASRTYLVDIQKKKLNKEMANLYDIPETIIPKIVPSGTKRGYLSMELQQKLNLEKAPYITVSGHDHMVGSVAVNLTRDDILNSTGTTEGILLRREVPNGSKNSYLMNFSNGIHVLGDYSYFGSLPTAGYAFDWLKSFTGTGIDIFNVYNNELYKDYLNNKLIEDPIYFIPHLRGSGPPDRNRLSTASFFNITDKTNFKSLLYGIVLGVTFELRYMMEAMKGEIDNFPKKLKVIGPATKNKLWLQLKADALNIPVHYYIEKEIVSLGTILLTELKNSNISKDEIEKISNNYCKVVHPNKDRVNQLNNLYKNYLIYRKRSVE